MGAVRGEQASYEVILDAALLQLEEHEASNRDALLERFPGCERQVDRALRAISSYHRFVSDDREQNGSRPSGNELADGIRIGEYEIVDLLGEGGMGVVYRARQPSLGEREVALKVLRSSLVAEDPRFVERFKREASLASRVHDPHVAEVYDYGKHEGQPYFTMQLIEGRSLAEVLGGLIKRQREGWTEHIRSEFVRQVVRLVRDLASGLAAIHSAGLVHRDVKPSNVILAEAGDDDRGALQAKPVLVDFGLVRTVGDSDLTGTLTRLGTPAFASPEVMLGREVGACADVFSLGAILHDLLCLTGAGSREPASSGLRSARSLNPAVDERLDAIVHMALEERAELRYADGGEFCDELERYLRADPVKALPQTIIGRARLWARRHPDRAIGLVGVGLSVSTLLAIWVGSWALPVYRANERAKASEQRGDLLAARSEWRTLDQEKLAFLLPFMEAERAQARKYWDSEQDVLWEPLQDLDAGRVHEAQLYLLSSLRAGYPSPDASLMLRFLAHELRDRTDVDRRTHAAETAARFLIDRPESFRPPYAAGSAELALCEALLDVVKAQGPEEPEHAMLVRSCASALGGSAYVEGFEALLPLLTNPDTELRRVASLATVRLWWMMRGEALPGFPTRHPKLLDWDQALWISWGQNLWEGVARYGVTGNEWYERSSGTNRWEAAMHAAGDAAVCLAWTRMELFRSGELDTEDWNVLPKRLLNVLELAQQCLQLTGEQEIELPASSDVEASLANWISPPKRRKDIYTRWLRPICYYEAYDRSTYEPQPLKSVIGDPEPEAMQASILFKAGDTPEARVLGKGAYQRFEWRGAIDPSLTNRPEASLVLTGLDESAYLLCSLPPNARQAHVSISFDFPAVWPLPSGISKVEVSINGGAHIVERVGAIGGTEVLKIPIHQFALLTQPDFEVEVRLTSGWMLWIHEIKVEFFEQPIALTEDP